MYYILSGREARYIFIHFYVKTKKYPKNREFILVLKTYLLSLKRNSGAVFVNSRKKTVCKIVRKLV